MAGQARRPRPGKLAARGRPAPDRPANPVGVAAVGVGAIVVVAAALTSCVTTPAPAGGPGTGTGPATKAAGAVTAPATTPGTARPTPSAGGTTAAPLRAGNAPAAYARQVRARAGQAGVNPQLLMAILFNEANKPHDPGLERAWLSLNPDAALGVANMHRAAYDDTKGGRDFAGRDWLELPDDPDLAIEAAAWYLHDLARSLPSRISGSLTRDELLALGYNAGPANMRAFSRGVSLGPQAQSYLQRLRDNWSDAGAALRTA
ncbi:MAG TPA: hypothetical protein VFP72_15390 [Kineosporiaceae bacterium]|nr:hypothetical protein [Kineosporiaceae bacterium]